MLSAFFAFISLYRSFCKSASLYILIIPCFTSLFSCTDFNLISEQGEVCVGRSMEFELDLQTQLVLFPQRNPSEESKGIEKSPSSKQVEPMLQWEKKYGYLAMTSFGPTLATDGMNAQGLSVGALWFVGATYPPINKTSSSTKPKIALKDLGHWILSSFATVEEVKEALPTVEIIPSVVEELNQMPPVHLSIHDALGKSIVIEFVDHALQIHDNPLGVLTNAPSLSWHLNNLRNYISLSPFNVSQAQLGPLSIIATGQGSGLFGLPGDWTPPSRFVRAALLKSFSSSTKNSQETITLAFHLLNVLDIPHGVIRSKTQGVDYTQWAVVKDLTNKKLYYRTYDNLQIQTVNLLEELAKETKIPRVLAHLSNSSLQPQK